MRWIVVLCLCILYVQLMASLKIAMYPVNEPAKMLAPLTVLAEYLTEKTGESYSAIVTRDYEEIMFRLVEGSLDIAWLTPVHYDRMRQVLPFLQYVATFMEISNLTGEVTPFYYALIITLKDSGIHSLEDTQGKRFAFTDPGSTSGYAYPTMLLRKRGIDPNSWFFRVFFLGRHDRVIQALINRSIDVGAVSDGTLSKAIEEYGDIFLILERSEPIPLDAIVAAGHITEEQIRRCREALVAIPPEHPFNTSMRENLGWPSVGFSVKEPSFYDGLREALFPEDDQTP